MFANKAIRIVCDVGYRDHTNKLFCSLKYLKCIDVEFKCVLLMYKVSTGNNVRPRQLQKHSNELGILHIYCTRSSGKGDFHCVYYARTILKSRCLNVLGVKMRNISRTCFFLKF